MEALARARYLDNLSPRYCNHATSCVEKMRLEVLIEPFSGYILSVSYIRRFYPRRIPQAMNPRLSANTFYICTYMRTFAKGAAQVDTPNETVTDLCNLKPPFFAKGTAQVNTPNTIGIFAICPEILPS